MSGYTPREMQLLKISDKYIEIIELVQLCPTQMTYWAKNVLVSWPGPHTEWHIVEGCTLNGLLSF